MPMPQAWRARQRSSLKGLAQQRCRRRRRGQSPSRKLKPCRGAAQAWSWAVIPYHLVQPDAVQQVIDALKEEHVDLVITLPEEPTYPLTSAIREDRAFTSITVTSEGHGIALAAG